MLLGKRSFCLRFRLFAAINIPKDLALLSGCVPISDKCLLSLILFAILFLGEHLESRLMLGQFGRLSFDSLKERNLSCQPGNLLCQHFDLSLVRSLLLRICFNSGRIECLLLHIFDTLISHFFSTTHIAKYPTNRFTIFGEMLCLGELFKNLFSFFFLSCEECGKLTLCQHCHATKLIVI